MGEKYTSRTLSGYNATPPADDGTKTEANKGYWATVKTKLADPVKNYADDINTAMATYADFGPITKSAAYTATTAEHLQTIECTGTFTLTLGASASMGAGYTVTIKNVGTGVITVDGSGAETIDGQASVTLDPLQGITVQADSTGTEYLTIAQKDAQFPTPAITAGLANTYTVTTGETAYLANKVYVAQINITNTGASTIDFDSLGIKNIKDLSGADPLAGMLYIGMAARFLYDGTNMVLTNPVKPIAGTVRDSTHDFANCAGMFGTQYRDYDTALSFIGITSYSTLDTLQIYIPPDATRLHYKIKCSTNSASYTSGGRIISPTASGVLFQTLSTTETWSGVLELDVSADSGWTTISIQVYVGGGASHTGYVHEWSWYIA